MLAGLSPLRIWCCSSMSVDSRISPTRLLKAKGNLSLEFRYCKIVVLSILAKTKIILTENAFSILSLSRRARKAA